MEMTKSTKGVVWLGGLCIVMFVFLLLFRAFIYEGMYKAPEDPYGISDIIEYLFGMALLAVLAISSIVSLYLLALGERQSKKSAVFLLLVCVALFFSASPLHQMAARWASA